MSRRCAGVEATIVGDGVAAATPNGDRLNGDCLWPGPLQPFPQLSRTQRLPAIDCGGNGWLGVHFSQTLGWAAARKHVYDRPEPNSRLKPSDLSNAMVSLVLTECYRQSGTRFSICTRQVSLYLLTTNLFICLLVCIH